MKCSRCQHETPPVARFCNGCGAPMEQACPQCGTVNPSGSRFCNGCGAKLNESAPPASQPRFVSPNAYTPKHLAEKILTSKASLEGERKQVTVLSADLECVRSSPTAISVSVNCTGTAVGQSWHASI